LKNIVKDFHIKNKIQKDDVDLVAVKGI